MLYDVGIMDIPRGWILYPKESGLWKHMLERCYNPYFINNHLSYKDVFVCREWLTFSNFLKDLPKIEGYALWCTNSRIALDKDIKGNSKLYCLEYCKFVTQADNNREMFSRRGNISKYVQRKIKMLVDGKEYIYDSISDCVRDNEHLKLDNSCISKVCRGKLKSYKGIIFEYIE